MTKNDLNLDETLLPALLQCFGIMFLGYILGRFKILRQKEAAGISTFVLYLALPALIFIRISTISFENVKWSFIASVFVAKAVIFIGVALMTMILTHPVNLGKAGIFAITTTLSNDFALGYPMFLALYKENHPDYPDFLYIIAPVQLLVFNTIGFFIMEMHKGGNNTRFHFLKVIKNTLTNPIVFMTIIGMIWNVSFNHQIPQIFKATLETLSAAFPATALFLVGHTMAIKSEKSDSHISINIALLIITKNLILPIILQKCCTLMMNGNNESEVESLSSFGFLYGATPTAPSAYVFATQYDISVDVITKTIIGSTLVSAPLMFASASVISLSGLGSDDISSYLTLTISYLSCVSLLCCGWILFSYIIGKRFQNISVGVIFYIIFSQLLTSGGGILLFFKITPYSSIFYAQYILSIGGILATRVSTLFLAVLLIVIRWRSLCFILQLRKHINLISILCILCPFLVTSCFLFIKNPQMDGPNNQLGHPQIIAIFTITVICFSGTVLCLILQHTCFRQKLMHVRNSIEENSNPSSNQEDIPTLSRVPVNENEKASLTLSDEQICVDVEDLDKQFANFSMNSENVYSNDIQESLCDSRYHCSTEKRLQCATRVSTYKKEDKYGLYDNTEIFQHTFLLIGLSVAMTVSLAVCFWKLIMEAVNGIYIELEFLDVIMNYSLGILFFIIFGFDNNVRIALSKKWKMLWCGHKNLDNSASNRICQDFIRKHKKKFQTAVEDSKASTCREYHTSFCSSDLIKWLIQNEDIQDVNSAEIYILHLLAGNVIEKVDSCEFFPDNAYIYRFTN